MDENDNTSEQDRQDRTREVGSGREGGAIDEVFHSKFISIRSLWDYQNMQ